MLQQMEVESNRLQRRPNAIPYSVQAYDAEDLATTASFDAFDFVKTPLFTAPCRSSLSFLTTSVRRRGQVISPEVFVDDSHYFGVS